MRHESNSTRLPPRDQFPLNRDGFRALSGREEQVLAYASSGYLDKQISNELGVSLNTLRTYWERIRIKIGQAPRSALASAYVRHVSSEAKPEDPPLAPTAVTLPAIDAVPPLMVDLDHDWEIVLDKDVWIRVSDRPVPIERPVGLEVPMDEVFSYFHPEDQPRLRALLVSIRKGEVEEFVYSGRIVTDNGIEIGSAMVRVVKDETGRPVRALGRRLAGIPLGAPESATVTVGNWTRDLNTGVTTCDSGFCSIFRIDPGAEDIRKLALARFHPDEYARARDLLAEAVTSGRERARSTNRLLFEDGSTLWIALTLKIDYENGRASTVHGTVMAF